MVLTLVSIAVNGAGKFCVVKKLLLSLCCVGGLIDGLCVETILCIQYHLIQNTGRLLAFKDNEI